MKKVFGEEHPKLPVAFAACPILPPGAPLEGPDGITVSVFYTTTAN